MNLSAVILAGGQSSRMGRDKARLAVEGESLLARQLRKVRALNPAEVFIAGRSGEDYSAFNGPVLFDLEPGFDPLGGIERARPADLRCFANWNSPVNVTGPPVAS